MSKEDRIARLKAIGVDADGLLGRTSALIKAHTVEKHEDPKNPEKVTGVIKPEGEHLLALIRKVIDPADIVPVEAFVENEVFELLK